MKYLLVALVVGVGFWLWRRGRSPSPAKPKARAASAQPPAGSALMVRCKTCGLHLPQAEALVTEKGTFCSEAHRSQA